MKKNFFDLVKEVPKWISNYNRLSMDIASRIEILLKDKNLNQKKLADLLGKKESEISKLLSGSHNFTIKTIAKLEEALNTQLLYTVYDFKNYLSNTWTNKVYLQPFEKEFEQKYFTRGAFMTYLRDEVSLPKVYININGERDNLSLEKVHMSKVSEEKGTIAINDDGQLVDEEVV
jgi:transcriptional regulator with XRE-family HTH domain